MTELLPEAQAAIRARIAEIDEEGKRLRQALTAVKGSSASASRGALGSASAPTRRAPRGQRRRQVISHLAFDPGARPAEIADAISASSSQVNGLLRKLRDENTVKKIGKGYELVAQGSKVAGAEAAAPS